MTTSYNDSQVLVHEPAKYVAKLRAHKKDGNLLLLKTDMDGGHGGGSDRDLLLKQRAAELAFALSQIAG